MIHITKQNREIVKGLLNSKAKDPSKLANFRITEEMKEKIAAFALLTGTDFSGAIRVLIEIGLMIVKET